MKSERLLSHYEKNADAPDAIGQLRRFILDLAVRGKLVPQDPKDEPAHSFLKRIDKRAQSSRRRNSGPVVEDERAFTIPDSWAWTTLGSVSTVIMGQSPPGATYNTSGDGVPLINGPVEFSSGPFGKTVINQYTTEPTNFCEEGDLLICVRGSTTGRTNVASFRACIGRGVAAIQSTFDDSFVRLFLWKSRYDIIEMGRGIAFPSVSKKQLEDLAIPFPPIAEQRRIFARVDELMTLCDRLEAARAARETARDRLAAASFARLNIPDPDTFQTDARFALNALPALTTRPDQIKQLRQTILNLAVRGKLVPQDPNDEPASALLKRIDKEKARAGQRGNTNIEIENEEILGELPPNWLLVPLITLGSWAIGSGFPKNEQGSKTGAHFFLKVSDMNLPGNEKYIASANNCIDDDAARRMRAKIHPPGTIIFPKIGGAIATNKRRILTKGSAIDNNCLGITFSNVLNIEWAFLLLTTLDFTIYQAGTAVPALQQGVLERIPVGLPPLTEQRRIVAKVDELMTLCDQLEASLTGAATARSRLLDALLAEALTASESKDKEAA